MITEREDPSNHQEWEKWASAIAKLSEQRAFLVMKGYNLFFDTVLGLPTIESQKNWRSYREQDITFVDIESLSGSSRITNRRINDIQTFFHSINPLNNIGIFDVINDRRDSHYGVYRYSAHVVAQSKYEGFKKAVVFHLSCGYSSKSEDWFERGFDYTLFGFNEDEQTIQEASELELLLLVNNLALLYSEGIKSRSAQATT